MNSTSFRWLIVFVGWYGNNSVNSTKTLQWSPLQPIVDFTAAISGVHCCVHWNPRQCLVESTARSECFRYLIVESNALQQNSLQNNRQKSGIDCNVTAFVCGLRCTLSKTAVQRNPLQKFKILNFGTVMSLSAEKKTKSGQLSQK